MKSLLVFLTLQPFLSFWQLISPTYSQIFTSTDSPLYLRAAGDLAFQVQFSNSYSLFTWVKFQTLPATSQVVASIEDPPVSLLTVSKESDGRFKAVAAKADLTTVTVDIAGAKTATWEFVSVVVCSVNSASLTLAVAPWKWNSSLNSISSSIQFFPFNPFSASIKLGGRTSTITVLFKQGQLLNSQFQTGGCRPISEANAIVAASGCHSQCGSVGCDGPGDRSCIDYVQLTNEVVARVSDKETLSWLANDPYLQGRNLISSTASFTGWYLDTKNYRDMWNLFKTQTVPGDCCGIGNRVMGIFRKDSSRFEFNGDTVSSSNEYHYLTIPVTLIQWNYENKWYFVGMTQSGTSAYRCFAMLSDSTLTCDSTSYSAQVLTFGNTANSKLMIGDALLGDGGVSGAMMDQRYYYNSFKSFADLKAAFTQKKTMIKPGCTAMNFPDQCTACEPGLNLSGNDCLSNCYSECTEDCVTCGAKAWECLTCASGLVLQPYSSQLCSSLCPSGYTVAGGKCVGSDSLIAEFIFSAISPTVLSTTVPELIALSGMTIDYFPPTFEVSDPLPSFKRGLYFKGNQLIQLPPAKSASGSPLRLGTTFTFAAWVRPQGAGSLFSKKESGRDIATIRLSASRAVEFLGGNPPVRFTHPYSLPSDIWVFMTVVVQYSSSTGKTTIALFLNGVQHAVTYSEQFYIRDESITAPQTIGASADFSDFYQGFMWKVAIWNYEWKNFASEFKSAGCPVGLAYCLSPCPFSQTAECHPCPTSCPFACTSASDCKMCSSGTFLLADDGSCKQCVSLCETCISKIMCQSCKVNIDLVDLTCECSVGYFHNLMTDKCEQCSDKCDKCDLHGCIKCSFGFSVIGNICEDASPIPSLTVTAENRLDVSFNKPMNCNIERNDFSLEISVNNDVHIVFKIVSASFVDAQTFSINLVFEPACIPTNTTATITFLNPSKVIDTDGIATSATSLTALLNLKGVGLVNSLCECRPGSFYDPMSDECEQCSNNCDKCELHGCIECAFGFSVIRNICERPPPIPSLTVTSENRLDVSFNKPMNCNIEENDFSLEISVNNDVHIVFQIASMSFVDAQTFSINLAFGSACIPTNTTATITFLNPSKVIDIYGVAISATSLTALLNPKGVGLVNSMCECRPGSFYDLMTDKCEQCSYNCDKCELHGCIECAFGFSLIRNSCEGASPIPSLTVTAENRLDVSFSKPMNCSIERNDFSLEISVNNDVHIVFQIVSASFVDARMFSIDLAFRSACIPTNTTATITFLNPSKIIDSGGVAISATSLTALLNPKGVGLVNSLCECRPGSFYDPMTDKCEQCSYNCDKCELHGCIECAFGFSLIGNSCEDAFPIPSLTVTAENRLDVSFNKPMNCSIEENDFSLEISASTDMYIAFQIASMSFVDVQTFSINLAFESAYIPINTTATITFLNPSKVIDVEGAAISATSLTAFLNPIGEPTPIAPIRNTPVAQQTAAVATTAASTSVVLSSLTSSPASLIASINLFQLITYIPLANLTIPKDFQSALAALNMGQIVPNPAYTLLLQNYSSQVAEPRMSDYGIESTLFFPNVASFGGVSLTILASYVPIWLLSKTNIPVFSARFKEMLFGFKWNTPVTLSIVLYLDALLYSFLQISHGSFETVYLIANTVCAYFVFIGFMALPIALSVLLYRNYSKFSADSIDEQFKSRWKVFIAPFAADRHGEGIAYYVLFFTRRIVLFLLLFFANGFPTYFAYINAAFSVVVSLTQMLGYVIFRRPFAAKIDLLESLFVEACTTIVFLTSLQFTIGVRPDWVGVMEETGLWAIRAAMAGSVAVPIVRLGANIIATVREYQARVRMITQKETIISKFT